MGTGAGGMAAKGWRTKGSTTGADLRDGKGRRDGVCEERDGCLDKREWKTLKGELLREGGSTRNGDDGDDDEAEAGDCGDQGGGEEEEEEDIKHRTTSRTKSGPATLGPFYSQTAMPSSSTYERFPEPIVASRNGFDFHGTAILSLGLADASHSLLHAFEPHPGQPRPGAPRLRTEGVPRSTLSLSPSSSLSQPTSTPASCLSSLGQARRCVASPTT